MEQSHLSLVIPGLLGPGAGVSQPDKLALKELKILLARAERSACATGVDACLFELFGMAPGRHLPIAAVTHALDVGAVLDGWWLRADPVYLQPDNTRVIMLGNHLLDIRQGEANALAEALRPLFASQGWEVETPSPKRWYLRLPEDPGVFFHPLARVLGKDIHHYLPYDEQGDKLGKRWRNLLNEGQMLLYTSATNEAREARNEPPINSLWFWGGGAWPEVPDRRFDQVWSNETLSLGLAKLTCTPAQGAPATGQEWLARASNGGEHLLVLGREQDLGTTAEAWPSFIEALNRDWFSPLFTAFKLREIEELRLYPGNGAVFQVSVASLSCWWKRPRRLATYQ